MNDQTSQGVIIEPARDCQIGIGALVFMELGRSLAFCLSFRRDSYTFGAVTREKSSLSCFASARLNAQKQYEGPGSR